MHVVVYDIPSDGTHKETFDVSFAKLPLRVRRLDHLFETDEMHHLTCIKNLQDARIMFEALYEMARTARHNMVHNKHKTDKYLVRYAHDYTMLSMLARMLGSTYDSLLSMGQ